MKKSEKILLIGAGIILLPMIASGAGNYAPVLKNFLPSMEGFSPVPIWDYKQWSWGYGTAAGFDPNKKPAGTITREKAWAEALQVINSHYSYLHPLITVNLKPQQWAALLSFSYNLGTGNADNLVPNINRQDETALVTQWKKYIYAGGQALPGLITRRNKEVELWLS